VWTGRATGPGGTERGPSREAGESQRTGFTAQGEATVGGVTVGAPARATPHGVVLGSCPRSEAAPGTTGRPGSRSAAWPCAASVTATPAAMAGIEPRSAAGSPPPPSDWGRLEAAILSGWRTFWQSVGKERAAPMASREDAEEDTSALTQLPVSGRGAGPGAWDLRPGRSCPRGRPVRAHREVTVGQVTRA
jgi:hypothetical protein